VSDEILLCIIVTAAALLGGVVLGSTLKEQVIVEHCQLLGKFHSKGVVYECRKEGAK
jgi:hypothetical protein